MQKVDERLDFWNARTDLVVTWRGERALPPPHCFVVDIYAVVVVAYHLVTETIRDDLLFHSGATEINTLSLFTGPTDIPRGRAEIFLLTAAS